MNKTQYTIYEIRHRDPFMLNTYVGTTRDFNKRKSVHRLRSRNEETYNYPLYQQIRHFGGWDNFIMRPLEIIQCETRREAECRETYWINQCNARMNEYKKPMTERELDNYKAQSSHKKSYANNREKKLDACRQYYLDNREEILKKRKENYHYVKVAGEARVPNPNLENVEC
jgi:hypothetical protein